MRRKRKKGKTCNKVPSWTQIEVFTRTAWSSPPFLSWSNWHHHNFQPLPVLKCTLAAKKNKAFMWSFYPKLFTSQSPIQLRQQATMQGAGLNIRSNLAISVLHPAFFCTSFMPLADSHESCSYALVTPSWGLLLRRLSFAPPYGQHCNPLTMGSIRG